MKFIYFFKLSNLQFYMTKHNRNHFTYFDRKFINFLRHIQSIYINIIRQKLSITFDNFFQFSRIFQRLKPSSILPTQNPRIQIHPRLHKIHIFNILKHQTNKEQYVFSERDEDIQNVKNHSYYNSPHAHHRFFLLLLLNETEQQKHSNRLRSAKEIRKSKESFSSCVLMKSKTISS